MHPLRLIFLDGERRLRTVWRFVIYILAILVAVVFAHIVLGIVLAFYFLLNQTEMGPGFPDRFEQWSKDNAWILMALTTPPMTVVVVGVTFLCRAFLDWRSLRSMGFVKPRNDATSGVSAGVLWGVLPILAALAVPWALGGYRLEGVSLGMQVIVLLPTLVLAAFNEELMFRGYLLQNLLDIRRPVFGVLFSSFLFWLVHSLNPSAWSSPLVGINLFGAGVVLALAYLVSGNIWFPTALHFGWNMAQGPFFSVPISGIQVEGIFSLRLTDRLPGWLTGGAFGLEASIMTTLVEAVLIGVFLAILRSRPIPATISLDAKAAQAAPEIVEAELADRVGVTECDAEVVD